MGTKPYVRAVVAYVKVKVRAVERRPPRRMKSSELSNGENRIAVR